MKNYVVLVGGTTALAALTKWRWLWVVAVVLWLGLWVVTPE